MMFGAPRVAKAQVSGFQRRLRKWSRQSQTSPPLTDKSFMDVSLTNLIRFAFQSTRYKMFVSFSESSQVRTQASGSAGDVSAWLWVRHYRARSDACFRKCSPGNPRRRSARLQAGAFLRLANLQYKLLLPEGFQESSPNIPILSAKWPCLADSHCRGSFGQSPTRLKRA
jgi:hypothetical protein